MPKPPLRSGFVTPAGGVRKMKIIGVLFFATVIACIVYAYYFMLNISYAIWAPAKASSKWVNISFSPGINWARPFFKWVVPVKAMLVCLALIAEAAKHVAS